MDDVDPLLIQEINSSAPPLLVTDDRSVLVAIEAVHYAAITLHVPDLERLCPVHNDQAGPFTYQSLVEPTETMFAEVIAWMDAHNLPRITFFYPSGIYGKVLRCTLAGHTDPHGTGIAIRPVD